MHDGGSQAGWTVFGETLKCVHCGGSWLMQPRSGRERGFCTRCAGFVCGMQNCWECVPEEQMLLNMEAKGRQDAQAATDDAERVGELLHVSSQEAFSQMVASLYAQRQRGIEYRERVNSNIRAIRGL